MRIGVDIRCLMETQYSGISEHAYNMLKSLFEIDKKNHYILFYNAARSTHPRPFSAPNVEYRAYHYPNRLFNLSIRFLKYTTIDRLIGGVDVLVMPNFLFTNISKKCKKLLIVHDLSFEIYPEFFTAKQRLWHRLIGPKKLCQQADTVLAISKNTARDVMSHYNVPSNSVKIVYPGVSEIFFDEIKRKDSRIADVMQKYKLSPGYVYSLGNLEPRKNLETLLSAFEKSDDGKRVLVIAGAAAWKYGPLYRRWNKSPARDRIRFIGYVDSDDRPALYAAASIFVYPSIYEGFGLPPLEAMACGTPVISSITSSIVESVGDAGILVDPYNISDLASAIQSLSSDHELRSALSQRGIKRASQFRWSTSAVETLKLIEHI